MRWARALRALDAFGGRSYMPCVRNIYYAIVANYMTCMPGVKTGCQYIKLLPAPAICGRLFASSCFTLGTTQYFLPSVPITTAMYTSKTSHLYGVKGTGDCGRARETETARARDFHDFNDAVVCKRAVDQHSTGAVDCPDHVRVTGCKGSDPQRDEQSHKLKLAWLASYKLHATGRVTSN